MQKLKYILFIVSAISTHAMASQLNCATRPTTEYSAPVFSFQADVDDEYLSGKNLQEFQNVTVISQEKKEIELLKIDVTYKPKKKSNQNRVRLLFDLPATSEHFDGIIHGVIFPKDLTKEESLEKSEDALTFRALVTSSTDSYHDGIISYFRIYCQSPLKTEE